MHARTLYNCVTAQFVASALHLEQQPGSPVHESGVRTPLDAIHPRVLLTTQT